MILQLYATDAPCPFMELLLPPMEPPARVALGIALARQLGARGAVWMDAGPVPPIEEARVGGGAGLREG